MRATMSIESDVDMPHRIEAQREADEREDEVALLAEAIAEPRAQRQDDHVRDGVAETTQLTWLSVAPSEACMSVSATLTIWCR